MFLPVDELIILTGRRRKAKQIQQLRAMGIPFYVNACGRPIVVRNAVEGIPSETPQPKWAPALAKLKRRA